MPAVMIGWATQTWVFLYPGLQDVYPTLSMVLYDTAPQVVLMSEGNDTGRRMSLIELLMLAQGSRAKVSQED